MTYSGTNVATTINLQPNTITDETHLTGNGSLGAFTFRELHADGASLQPPVGCSGPNFAVVAGAGVFTFEDGSLLVVTVADGSACMDLAAGNAAVGRQFETYHISGGTGRFREAAASRANARGLHPSMDGHSGSCCATPPVGPSSPDVYGRVPGNVPDFGDGTSGNNKPWSGSTFADIAAELDGTPVAVCTKVCACTKSSHTWNWQGLDAGMNSGPVA